MPTPVSLDKLVLGKLYLLKYDPEYVRRKTSEEMHEHAYWSGLHSRMGRDAGPEPVVKPRRGFLAQAVFLGFQDDGTPVFNQFQILRHATGVQEDIPPVNPDPQVVDPSKFVFAAPESVTARLMTEQMLRQREEVPADVGVEIARGMNAHEPVSIAMNETNQNPWSVMNPRPAAPGNPFAPPAPPEPAFAAAGEGFAVAAESTLPARLAAAAAEQDAASAARRAARQSVFREGVITGQRAAADIARERMNQAQREAGAADMYGRRRGGKTTRRRKSTRGRKTRSRRHR